MINILEFSTSALFFSFIHSIQLKHQRHAAVNTNNNIILVHVFYMSPSFSPIVLLICVSHSVFTKRRSFLLSN